MSEAAPPGDRRAQWVILCGLFLQLILFGAVLTVGLLAETRSDAMVAVARSLLGGVPIWIILLLVFTQRRRSRLEDLETEQIKRAQAAGISTNVFDVADESLLLERRRLNWTYKFLLPAFSVLLAAYHVGGSFITWTWPFGRTLDVEEWHRSPSPVIGMIVMGAVAFVCFVFSRYVVGMSREPKLRLIRAAGSYLMGNALVSTLLVVAFAFAGGSAAGRWAEPLAAYIVRFTLLFLGLEFVVNFILEFYRPRHAEDDIRPAFDSRLLALFSEPGGIVRSIAETINYQFGFEVSGTWIYKVVQRSLFPLAAMTVFSLILLSSVVVVDVDELAFVERFGAVEEADIAAPLEPGFHLKWPWPVDRVVRERINRMRSLTVGSEHREGWEIRENVAKRENIDHEAHGLEHAELWTDDHERVANTSLMIVANLEDGRTSDKVRDTAVGGNRSTDSRAGVNLLMVSVTIEYYIESLHDYVYNYVDPVSVLESIAHQELSDYAASHDAEFLMGPGRRHFHEQWKQALQERCDEAKLGVAVTLVGLHAHPPATQQVAATFQNVISAEVRMEATVEKAKGMYDRVLTLTAGNVARAEALDAAAREHEHLNAIAAADHSAASLAAKESARQRVTDLLLGNPGKGIEPISGGAAAAIFDAKAKRAASVGIAQSKFRTTANDLIAYQSAPELFKARRRLAVWREALPGLRKFVYTSDPDTLIIEYETKQRTVLDLAADDSAGGPQ